MNESAAVAALILVHALGLFLFDVDPALILSSSVFWSVAAVAGDRLILRKMRSMTASARHLETLVERAESGVYDERVNTANLVREMQPMGAALDKLLLRTERLVVGLRCISGNVAHEMARPIARAVETARVISEEAQAVPPDFDTLLEQVEQLQQIYSGILDVVELEAGSEFKLEKVAFDDVVLEAALVFEEIAEEKAVEVELDCENCHVVGNYWLLLQAISNLLSNALRFAPEGGHVHMICRQHGDDIRFRIEDNGSGVADTTLEDLLTRIRRERSEVEEMDHGLGLRMVLATVIRHGGRMYLDQITSGGFCAVIELPMASLEEQVLR